MSAEENQILLNLSERGHSSSAVNRQYTIQMSMKRFEKRPNPLNLPMYGRRCYASRLKQLSKE